MRRRGPGDGRCFRLRRQRRRTHAAQVALDHRQTIDHMAKGIVNGFERILGMAVAFALAETDIRQFALNEIGDAGVLRRRHVAAVLGQRGEVGMLGFEVAQDVLQAVLDPSEVAAATLIAGRFEALEQIGDALFEMGEGGCAVVADRHAVEPVGQRPQRALQLFGVFSRGGPRPAFQRRGQGGDALLEDREGIAIVAGAAELVDLRRQHVDVVGQPGQRVGGRDIGDDRAKGCDSVFELMDRGGIVIAAQDQIELGAEITDRLLVTGELFGRGQRAQHFADLAQCAFDAGERLAVGAALAGIVDAARQRTDFVLDRFDRPARHRLGNGGANLGQFDPEGGDRLFDPVGPPQRFDLAGDLEQMALERGEIRPRRRGRCGHVS